MNATVLLCLISTATFCLCLRATMALVNHRLAPAVSSHSNFNVRARRIARGYAAAATSLLAFVAFVGAVRFYIELFEMF